MLALQAISGLTLEEAYEAWLAEDEEAISVLPWEEACAAEGL